MTIGSQIRTIRQVRGLAQRQLGRRVDVSGSCTSLIENGEDTPPPELLSLSSGTPLDSPDGEGLQTEALDSRLVGK